MILASSLSSLSFILTWMASFSSGRLHFSNHSERIELNLRDGRKIAYLPAGVVSNVIFDAKTADSSWFARTKIEFPSYSLSKSPFTFKGNLDFGIPAVVYPILELNFYAVIQVNKATDSLTLLRFSFNDTNDLQIPEVRHFDINCSLLGRDESLLRRVTKKQLATMMEKSDENHQESWSKFRKYPIATLFSFVAYQDQTHRVRVVICEVYQAFECEVYMDEIVDESMYKGSKVVSVRAARDSIVLVMKNGASVIPYDLHNKRKQSFKKDMHITHIAHFKNRFFGILDQVTLCSIETKDKELKTDHCYDFENEHEGFRRGDILFTSFLSTADHLLGEFEEANSGRRGVKIFRVDQGVGFFKGMEDENEDDQRFDFSCHTYYFKKGTQGTPRIFEWKGKIIIVEDEKLKIMVLKPTKANLPNKKHIYPKPIDLNQTNRIIESQYRLCIPSNKQLNTFSILSSKPYKPKSIDYEHIISEVILGNLTLNFEVFRTEELRLLREIKFKVHYYNYPDYQEKSYTVAFVERRVYDNEWIRVTFALSLILLLVFLCLCVRKSLEASKRPFDSGKNRESYRNNQTLMLNDESQNDNLPLN